MRMIEARKREAALVVALLTLGLIGCAHMKSPEQLSPVGDVAWHARQAVEVVDTMVKAAADGVRSGVISKEDGLKIAEAAEKAKQAGDGLVSALKAGEAVDGSKNQFLAALRRALQELPGRLDSNTGKMIGQYTSLALTLLSIFGA